MVDFANSNLCGASIELNNVLSKLDEAKAEIKSKLDEAASIASEAFLAKSNELTSLKDKLQTIEIPTIPKLNLQAEITSLLSQATGSAAYVSALAKISSEFKTDIEAKGLTLESLVDAVALSSDLICGVIPNLEKEAGSTVPAVEKPVAVKQAVEKAVTELRSVIKQNPNITEKLTSILEKTANFKTTAIPPTADTPAFKFVPSSIIKSISISMAPGAQALSGTAAPGANIKAITDAEIQASRRPTPVALPPTKVSERKNYVPDDKAAGFSYKKSAIYEYFSIAGTGQYKKKLVMSGGQCQLPLKHKPTGSLFTLGFYPGEHYTKTYIDDSFRKELGLTEESSDANKQFYYQDHSGKHLALLIKTPKYENPRTNFSVIGNTFIFTPPITLSDHPGNLDSGGTHLVESDLAKGQKQVVTADNFWRRGYEPFMRVTKASVLASRRWDAADLPGRIDVGKNRGSMLKSDSTYNKLYKGFSVVIRYEYLEKYDPDYKPA